jgi:hypothetical protein
VEIPCIRQHHKKSEVRSQPLPHDWKFQKLSGSTVEQNRGDERVEIERVDKIDQDQKKTEAQHSFEKQMDEIETEDKNSRGDNVVDANSWRVLKDGERLNDTVSIMHFRDSILRYRLIRSILLDH